MQCNAAQFFNGIKEVPPLNQALGCAYFSPAFKVLSGQSLRTWLHGNESLHFNSQYLRFSQDTSNLPCNSNAVFVHDLQVSVSLHYCTELKLSIATMFLKISYV